MFRPRVLGPAGLLAVVLATAGGAEAQPAPATVTGTGTAEVRRQPETLRVYFEVLARGKTTKEALEKLKARREEVRGELEKLGARKDGVAFADATLADSATDTQRRVDRFIRDRNGALGRPKAKGGASSVVAGVVRADFPLPADDPDAFLAAAHDLREKVKAGDFGGLKDKGKTPEDEEAADEALGQPNDRDGLPPRGEPVFQYVAKVPEAERAKAAAAAFARARREAERLAGAAGADLGGLHRLGNRADTPDDFEARFSPDRQFQFFAVGQLTRGFAAPAEDGDTEAVGVEPAKVTLRVAVSAEFALRPRSGK